MDLRDTNRPIADLLNGSDAVPDGDSAKLPEADGVPSDMGSATFERVMPAGFVGAGQQGNALRVQPGGAPAAGMDDAEVMLRVQGRR